MINKKNIQNLITNKSNTKEQIEKKNLKKKKLDSSHHIKFRARL
jgi:hypothetical protein